MFERRSLKLPITLGVTMIVLLIAIIVGWILLAIFGAITAPDTAYIYWTVLSVGTTFLVLVLVGVVMYLALSIKAINLNRRQSNFMDSITHELKSPIASLKLYLQTLNRRQVNPDERESFFRVMLEDVERLDHLINHMLDAARLDRKPIDSEYEDVALDRLLVQCAEELRLRYRASANAVTADTEPCVIRARRVDVDMIFRNLIDNGLKYAGQPPEVTIVLRVEGGNTIVTLVKDNGSGVPLRFRHKIFRRFVRLGSELERDKPGTGLGLYIVQTLVSRLKGRVRVHDREDATGTVFEVRLPGRPAEGVESRESRARGATTSH